MSKETNYIKITNKKGGESVFSAYLLTILNRVVNEGLREAEGVGELHRYVDTSLPKGWALPENFKSTLLEVVEDCVLYPTDSEEAVAILARENLDNLVFTVASSFNTDTVLRFGAIIAEIDSSVSRVDIKNTYDGDIVTMSIEEFEKLQQWNFRKKKDK